MLDLNAAERLIADGLAIGTIGTPVAVRLIAHLSKSTGVPEPLEAWASRCAAGWLRSAPQREESVSAAGQSCRLVAFDGGQTALLSTGTAAPHADVLLVTVFGSHGTLNWSDPPRRANMLCTGADAASQEVRPPLKPPYGVLLVAGDHTHQPMYAAAFRADSRCRLIGLTDEQRIEPQRRRWNQQLADRLRVPLLEDFDQAIAREDVHIASICAEPIRRGPLIVRAARAGKHLYLDKPLAGSLDDLDRIVAAVRETGVLAHMFSSLTAPPMERIRRILHSGQLGLLRAIHLDLCFAKGLAGSAQPGAPRRETFPPPRYEVAEAKRELTNVGVYPLVLLAALCGHRPRRVAATTGNYFFAEHQQHDMEDFGQVVLELDEGVIGSCCAGRAGWQSHPADGLNRVTLIGDEDVAVIEAHWPRAEIWSDAPPWQPPPRNPLDPMAMWVAPPDSPYAASPKRSWLTPPALSPTADVACFLDCLQNGRESEANAAVSAVASEILLACYQSAAEQRSVTLPLSRRTSAQE
ncbi:MAG: Gfo/Idh/MocA family oxidoreductase [Planctomycetes bacterium]|nr:Gfo/Idh/MocA family oxidoreductase [Planctomycetota bacterium]